MHTQNSDTEKTYFISLNQIIHMFTYKLFSIFITTSGYSLYISEPVYDKRGPLT